MMTAQILRRGDSPPTERFVLRVRGDDSVFMRAVAWLNRAELEQLRESVDRAMKEEDDAHRAD